MKSVLKKELDFSKMTSIKGGFCSDSYYYIDEYNKMFYKMFVYGLINPQSMQKKLEEIENLHKDYISNPTDIVYNYDLDLDGYGQRLINGEKLNSLVNRRTILEHMKTIVKISKNLEDLHNSNVVIGDIGFHNIMIDENGNPIFIDIDSVSINEFKSKTVSTLLGNYYGRKNKFVDIGTNSDNIGLYLAVFKTIFGREINFIANDTYLHEISSCPILSDLYEVYSMLSKRNEKIPNVPYLHQVLKNYDNK